MSYNRNRGMNQRKGPQAGKYGGNSLFGAYGGMGSLEGGRRYGDDGRGAGYQSYVSERASQQVNPWEGGRAPNELTSGSQSSVLSHISLPQAQLALASDLISKLLTPATQTPSLLNLSSMLASNESAYGGYNNYERQGRQRGAYSPDHRRPGLMGRDSYRRPQQSNFKQSVSARHHGASPSLNKTNSVKRKWVPDNQRKKDQKKDDTDSKSGESKEEDKSDSVKADGDAIKEEPKSDGGEEESKKGEEKGEDVKKRRVRTKIPEALFYCQVCKKKVWDEPSFDKHRNGNFHKVMLERLDEHYKLKTDMYRHVIRTAEERNEMETMRHKKDKINMQHQYCIMCNLKFFGTLIHHRANARHQKLKNFLHPKCHICLKEFPTRLEYDDHRSTLGHIRKIVEAKRAVKPNMKDEDFSIKDLVMKGDSDDFNIADIKEKDMSNKPKDPEKQLKELPEFDATLTFGEEVCKPVNGFICRTCNRFMPGEDDVTLHCATQVHYDNYKTHLENKVQELAEKKQKEEEEKERKKAAADAAALAAETTPAEGATGAAPLDVSADDDEGNWKRRKISNEKEDNETDKEDKSKMIVIDEVKENDESEAENQSGMDTAEDVKETTKEEIDQEDDELLNENTNEEGEMDVTENGGTDDKYDPEESSEQDQDSNKLEEKNVKAAGVALDLLSPTTDTPAKRPARARRGRK